jgi:hypothetical protein
VPPLEPPGNPCDGSGVHVTGPQVNGPLPAPAQAGALNSAPLHTMAMSASVHVPSL